MTQTPWRPPADADDPLAAYLAAHPDTPETVVIHAPTPNVLYRDREWPTSAGLARPDVVADRILAALDPEQAATAAVLASKRQIRMFEALDRGDTALVRAMIVEDLTSLLDAGDVVTERLLARSDPKAGLLTSPYEPRHRRPRWHVRAWRYLNRD